MTERIAITLGTLRIHARLLDTPTARAIHEALPIESHAQTWGDEVYFPVPVSCELEEQARDVVNAGELAFWVEGNCIAIGFGPTPLSAGDEIRLAARTNIWAHSEDDVRQLKVVKAGDRVTLEAL